MRPVAVRVFNENRDGTFQALSVKGGGGGGGAGAFDFVVEVCWIATAAVRSSLFYIR